MGIKTITVEIDTMKPVLNLLIDSIDEFFTQLLNDMPYTYYVDVTVGNNHSQMVTIPIKKIFRGGGPAINIDESVKNWGWGGIDK